MLELIATPQIVVFSYQRFNLKSSLGFITHLQFISATDIICIHPQATHEYISLLTIYSHLLIISLPDQFNLLSP